MQFPGEVMISADQQDQHDGPAGQISCVDDPHIMEDADQDLTPYDPENTVGKQGSKRRIGGIAQTADGSDIHLVDGVEPVKRNGIPDGLHAVVDDQGIRRKESHDVRGQGHQETGKDDAAGYRQTDTDMNALIYAVPFCGA